MQDSSPSRSTGSPPLPQGGLVWAIVLAAGKGRRLAAYSGAHPKQFLHWLGRPLWWHSAKTLADSPLVRGLVFVFPENRLGDAEASLRKLDAEHELGLPWVCVQGGDRRQDSVRLALKALPRECGYVLVHDSARPFMTASLISRVMEPLLGGSQAEKPVLGVVPGLTPTDTIKEVTEAGEVVETPIRANLRAVQTPQAFVRQVLAETHQRAEREDFRCTDDASLLEQYGYKVTVVEGEETNKKITLPKDLELLEQGAPIRPCSGWGYDVHRYGGTRPLVIGGMPIAGPHTVLAHSDGDVLLHALMDAILGCVGLGDIGTHFPDTDPQWEGASSSLLLNRVMELARDQGLEINHVDLTVIAQKPKLAPHATAIRRNVARMLDLPETHVNFKATTEEGLGFTGDMAGLKAVALVSGMR